MDVFNNMVLIKETPGYVLFEPLPLRETPAPPIVPDSVDLTRKDALVNIHDIYVGPGLEGIPRGTVKTDGTVEAKGNFTLRGVSTRVSTTERVNRDESELHV